MELAGLQIEIMQNDSLTADISHEIDNLKQYAEITELNRGIVTSLIQSILVSEPRKVDGQKVYDIEIRYKFQNPRTKKIEVKKEDTSLPYEISSEPYSLSRLASN